MSSKGLKPHFCGGGGGSEGSILVLIISSKGILRTKGYLVLSEADAHKQLPQGKEEAEDEEEKEKSLEELIRLWLRPPHSIETNQSGELQNMSAHI